MAPIKGPSRQEVLKILRGWFAGRKLPLTLSHQGAPAGVIRIEDGKWCLHRLRMNEARREADEERRQAAGDTYYVPEMTWRFLEPGELLAASESKKDFLSLVAQMDWPFD
ncbi:MAG: hypothetical protein JXR96_15445 [Deltaproteobacteria bacterium]|nr:hypothetical protein [Deltaproteobacteria bacterium]